MVERRKRGRPRVNALHFIRHGVWYDWVFDESRYRATHRTSGRVWYIVVRLSEYVEGKWLFELSTEGQEMVSARDYGNHHNAAHAAWYELQKWDEELDHEAKLHGLPKA